MYNFNKIILILILCKFNIINISIHTSNIAKFESPNRDGNIK